jgi:hypothetical protein
VTSIQPIFEDPELAPKTTRRLARNLESMALLVQAIGVAVAGTIDKVSPSGRALLYLLAGAHLAFAVAVRTTPGPFTRGGIWMGVWASMTLIMPLTMAHLAGPGEYGAYTSCVQLCGYPMAPLLILAFYPWISLRLVGVRLKVELAFLALVLFEPLLIITRLHDGHVSASNLISVAVSGTWNVAAYAAGKAVGQLCRTAVQSQIDLQQDDYREFVNFIHSHLEGAISVIQTSPGDADLVVKQLSELNHLLIDRRVEMLLWRPRVPLADVFKEAFRLYEPGLRIVTNARVGARTVDRPIGVLISRTLGDLLKNASQHGASTARVNFSIDGDKAILDVIDDGPGFASELLDDQSTSLHRLWQAASDQAGELSRLQTREGSHMRLSLPL